MKYIGYALAALLFIALGFVLREYYPDFSLSSIGNSQEVIESAPQESESDEMCAQVITPALNPATGEIREFPTPCDVPESWEVIMNDIPGLELEVQ